MKTITIRMSFSLWPVRFKVSAVKQKIAYPLKRKPKAPKAEEIPGTEQLVLPLENPKEEYECSICRDGDILEVGTFCTSCSRFKGALNDTANS